MDIHELFASRVEAGGEAGVDAAAAAAAAAAASAAAAAAASTASPRASAGEAQQETGARGMGLDELFGSGGAYGEDAGVAHHSRTKRAAPHVMCDSGSECDGVEPGPGVNTFRARYEAVFNDSEDDSDDDSDDGTAAGSGKTRNRGRRYWDAGRVHPNGVKNWKDTA
eukprot:CAMPEP_0115850014 /NCGR_PEP_ID=MMETSP0287-20121206/11746_1 /TAXON_ID=412157 /ORGANISM="Chrysochromulina rotalis, Strain UIO044" /LENGTH=166 /DNA_ID=CAMNT_0003303999 /DNA_START=217 /DNA_END=713 /DNA_ORIENTATION=+